jgi:hypothetical protein
MKHKLVAFSLAFILVLAPLARGVRAQAQANDARKTARVKSDISKRVAGRNTRVTIKLLSGAELKGRIEQADHERFTLTEDKTGKSVSLAYSEVRGVKGRGLGTGAKIGIIAAVTVGLLVTVVVLGMRNFDPFKHGVLR